MKPISASEVMTLRGQTGAPMMDCKRALEEAQGDIERAEIILQAKLGGRVSKGAGRVAAEGAVFAWSQSGVGALVELNCETDFVSQSEAFQRFGHAVAQAVAQTNPGSLDEALSLSLEDGTVESARVALAGKLGENISIRGFDRVESQSRVAAYSHNGKIGVLVAFDGEPQVGSDVAMHIAAMKPMAVAAEDLPADQVAKARVLAQEKADRSGKPPKIAEKMVEGGVRKFIEESALLSQPFVRDEKRTVGKVLSDSGARIFSFALCVAGEGLSKPQTNFAAEVAAQAAAANPGPKM